MWRQDWHEIPAGMDEDERRSVYRVQSYDRELYGQPLRCVVVHSSQLEQRQQGTLLRQMSKEKE